MSWRTPGSQFMIGLNTAHLRTVVKIWIKNKSRYIYIYSVQKKLHAICALLRDLLWFGNGWFHPSYSRLFQWHRDKHTTAPIPLKQPGINGSLGPWFNIKMSSYQYRKSHCGDKTVVRSSYLQNGISYTGKMISFYWIGPRTHKNW